MAVSNYDNNNEFSSKTLNCISELSAAERIITSDVRGVYKRFVAENQISIIEYKMDEMDRQWLSIVNKIIQKKETERELPVKMFEYLMDSFEKEANFSSPLIFHNDEVLLDNKEDICSICEGKQEDEIDIILKCNMCSVKVHKTCYGIMYPPKSRWFCRKCWYSPSKAVQCMFCPFKNGALIQTENNKWAHIICASMFPYAYFENSVLLEKVKFVDPNSIEKQLKYYRQLKCYICKYAGKTHGICLQCDEVKCLKAYHVTCAQKARLCMNVGTNGRPMKLTYCHVHSLNNENKHLFDKSKIDTAGRILRNKRNEIQITTSPIISSYSLHVQIIEKIFQPPVYPILKYSEAFKRTYAYWNLKRENRNGVPLLQKLQSSSYRIMKCKAEAQQEKNKVQKVELESCQKLNFWKYMEKNLEKVKKLCYLIHTIEEHKHNLIKRLGELTKSLLEIGDNKENILNIHRKIKLVKRDLDDVVEQVLNIDIQSPIPDIIDHDTYPNLQNKVLQDNNWEINEQLPALSRKSETPKTKNNRIKVSGPIIDVPEIEKNKRKLNTSPDEIISDKRRNKSPITKMKK